MFGGKGNHIAFYETGDELFQVMCQLEESLSLHSFFVMDENFLLYRPRALRLLDLIERTGKEWSLQVFSSAKVVQSYSLDELIRLGLAWLWVGLEGEDSGYTKLERVDTFKLVRELRSHGVRVLGSTILGLPNHTPEDMDRVIDYAVQHNTDFHQFMYYSPSPGTPFYRNLEARGLLKPEGEFPWPEWHGQLGFSWRHPNFGDGEETPFILQAFPSRFRSERSECSASRSNASAGPSEVQRPSGRQNTSTIRQGVTWPGKAGGGSGGSGQGVLPRSSGPVRQDVSTAGGSVRRVWWFRTSYCGDRGPLVA